MIDLVYLETSLDALDETKNNGADQNQDSHPESVPLYAVAAVVPPLRKDPRGSVVINLFQDHKPVSPEFELFNLAPRTPHLVNLRSRIPPQSCS